MSFPRYPKYKPSGVEWLEEVPEQWEVRSIQSLARNERNAFIDGDWIESPFITEEGIRLLQTGNIGVGQFKEQGFRFISNQTFVALGCTEVNPGDVLICRLAEPVGRACIAPNLGVRMITSVDVSILKPFESVSAKFLVYLLTSAQYLGFMEGQCRGGTRDRVSRSFLGKVRLSIPSLLEQQTIASFLDHETAKIDALIAEQQRLIELLKEKRQAVISHAVTKGLNPHVRMKDSGVEWLGEVPVHWAVSSLSHFARFCTGSTPARDNPAYWNGEIPWVKTGEINYNLILETEESITKEGLDNSSCTIAPAGTMLMALYGQGVTRGRVAILGVPTAFNQACVAISVGDQLSVDYLQNYFTFAYPFIRDGGNETTQMNMNVEYVKHIKVIVPPWFEQQAITQFLKESLGIYCKIQVQVEKALALLQERRTALISAAVTGQIDVRGFQPVAA